MRKFLSLLSFFFCIALGAQKLSVESFKAVPNDLSARTAQRVDNNGVPCALIKVQLASAGALFEGSVVGKVEYKTSEYWVYMPKGTKRLNVKLEGYLPLPVEFEPLESSTTYVLTITGVVNNAGQQQEQRTKTGWIILESEPQGAAVYINGEFVGNTPLDSYKQPYGTYSYRLEMPNYHEASGTIELNAAQYENTVTLRPAFGSISVTSSVSGATVLLDGKSTGKTTPCTLEEIPSGQHTITLQLNKYAPQQLSVTVEDGQTAKASASLDARFAQISISTLQGAEILIDGTRKGSTQLREDLMEGYHDVEVRLAHHKPATKQLQVVAGQAQSITLNPTPIYGSLDIVSTPRKAEVTIDGKPVGQTPFTVEQLLEGEHTVTLTLAGYSTETKTVSIAEGQTASVSATLQSGREITISTKEVGSRIYIDGKEVGPSPYKGSLAFGSHTIYAVLNGKKTLPKTITSEKGEGALPSVTLVFESHEYVDLGLSVKWATCNVGADKPEDYGDYYAWGETETKSTYRWSTYKWCNGSNTTMTKYCTSSSYGTVDNKTTLDPEDDVAHAKWGGNWRMPTDAEFAELIDTNNCTWTWTTQGGKKGYKVTSKKNGNSIFLPAAGYRYDTGLYSAGSYGSYCSSLNTSRPCYVYYLGFSSSYVSWLDNDRDLGQSVRPVCP